MHNFREAYKSAVDHLPGLHLDVCRVQDELHHHRMAAAKRKKTFMSVAAAACVFLVCGAGTIAAVNYSDSEVNIFNNGFSFTNQKRTSEGEAGDLPEAAAEYPNGAAYSAAAAGADTAGAAGPEGSALDRSLDRESPENAMGGGR